MTAKKASAKKSGGGRRRSRQSAATKIKRPYPRVSLKKALDVVAAIKEKNGGNLLEPALVAEFCGISATNNDFVYLLSAASQFGLTSGTIRSAGISLTDFGRQLAYAGSPGEEESLKRQVFLNVEIFRRVLEHYRGSQLPELKYLGNTLSKQFEIPEPLHDEFSRVFRENTEYLGLATYDSHAGSPDGPIAESGSSSSGAVVIGQPKKKTGKVCFVITPFGERSGKYPTGFFSEVLNSLIIPAATEAGFEV